MKRLLMGPAVVLAIAGLVVALLPAATCAASSNTATTLFPVDDASQLETHTLLNCHGNGSCDFTAGVDLRTPDGATGFPPSLWARQTTEIRPDEPVDVPGRARHQPVRAGHEGGRVRRDHHRLLR